MESAAACGAAAGCEVGATGCEKFGALAVAIETGYVEGRAAIGVAVVYADVWLV